MWSFNLALHLLIIINFSAALLPSIFPVCFRHDPQISSCLVQSVKAFQSRMTTGDLGDGFKIPRLDPLYIPKHLTKLKNMPMNTIAWILNSILFIYHSRILTYLREAMDHN
ncbi:hypothetical protein ACKWTF_016383 [Chironomus riparius]